MKTILNTYTPGIRYFLTSIFSILVVFAATAQNTATIIDRQSNEPLQGVTVSLINKKGGTISDEDGKFQIGKLPKISDNDTLYFSHVSYVTEKIAAKELAGMDYIICLTPLTKSIDQVTVLGKQNLQDELKFEELAPLREGLFSFGAVMEGDYIYVIGGDNSINEENLSTTKPNFTWEGHSNKLQIYDIVNDSWIISDQKFAKRACHNVHFNNGKLYVLGGKRLAKNKKLELLNDLVEVYDINRDTLIVDKTNPHQTVNFASAMYDGNIIMLGGSLKEYPRSKGKLYSDKAHMLDLSTGYWYKLDNIPYAKETKGILIGDTMYLIGGHRNRVLNYLDTYNVRTGEYTSDELLPIKCERPALAYANDIIYIFENSTIQTYNINTKEIFLYPIALELTGSEMFYKNNKLYILGGCTRQDESYFPSEKLYTVDISEFKRTQKSHNN